MALMLKDGAGGVKKKPIPDPNSIVDFSWMIPKNTGGGAGGGSGGTGGGNGGGSGGVGTMGYNPIKAKSAAELAALYGVTNDRNEIAKTLDDATQAKFGMWDTQMKGIRDQQLTDYSSQFDQYAQYQRQNRQNSLRNGMSRGGAVAQEVMSQVSNQAYGAQNQAGYQKQLADIAAQKGAQIGADKYNALDMSNQLGLQLGNLSTTQQQTDTAGLTGYQQYLADLEGAKATRYAADQGLAGQKYSADKNFDAYNVTYTNAIKAGYTPAQAAALANGESKFNKTEPGPEKPKPKDDKVKKPVKDFDFFDDKYNSGVQFGR